MAEDQHLSVSEHYATILHYLSMQSPLSSKRTPTCNSHNSCRETSGDLLTDLVGLERPDFSPKRLDYYIRRAEHTEWYRL